MAVKRFNLADTEKKTCDPKRVFDLEISTEFSLAATRVLIKRKLEKKSKMKKWKTKSSTFTRFNHIHKFEWEEEAIDATQYQPSAFFSIWNLQ